MYSAEPIASAIAYRCINENLPKFIHNLRSFEKVKESLTDKIAQIDTAYNIGRITGPL